MQPRPARGTGCRCQRRASTVPSPMPHRHAQCRWRRPQLASSSARVGDRGFLIARGNERVLLPLLEAKGLLRILVERAPRVPDVIISPPVIAASLCARARRYPLADERWSRRIVLGTCRSLSPRLSLHAVTAPKPPRRRPRHIGRWCSGRSEEPRARPLDAQVIARSFPRIMTSFLVGRHRYLRPRFIEPSSDLPRQLQAYGASIDAAPIWIAAACW